MMDDELREGRVDILDLPPGHPPLKFRITQLFPENPGSHGGRREDLGREQGLQVGELSEEHPQVNPGASGAPGMI